MPAEKLSLIAQSPLRGKYEQRVDSESAHETLSRRMAQRHDSDASLRTAPPVPSGPLPGGAEDEGGAAGKVAAAGMFAAIGAGILWFLKAVLRAIGYQLVRDLARRATGRAPAARRTTTRRRR